MGYWIPTTEREPFEDGKYLVTIKYEDTPEPVVTTREYFVKSGWEHAHLKNVLAWMPLPAAYEPAKETK